MYQCDMLIYGVGWVFLASVSPVFLSVAVWSGGYVDKCSLQVGGLLTQCLSPYWRMFLQERLQTTVRFTVRFTGQFGQAGSL